MISPAMYAEFVLPYSPTCGRVSVGHRAWVMAPVDELDDNAADAGSWMP